MNFIYIALGMTTLLVFLYKREWLLNKNSALALLGWNLVLFILGSLLFNFEVGNPKMVVALKMPLLAQVIFIVLVSIFRKIYKYDPVDTFWTMDTSLMKDGIFNFLFFSTAIIFPAILVFMGYI